MKPCEDRKETLLDLALGAAPSPEFEAHLAACHDCAAALAALRRTADQMDRAVVRIVAAEPHPSGPAQVLSRLPARRAAWLRWRFAAAAFAAAVCIVIVLVRDRPAPSVADISAWRSPTASLLHSPTDALFKNVPRFGEDFLNMKTIGEKDAH